MIRTTLLAATWSLLGLGALTTMAAIAQLLAVTVVGVAGADSNCLWCVARDEALNNLLNGLGAMAGGALGLGAMGGGPLRDAAESAYDGLGAAYDAYEAWPGLQRDDRPDRTRAAGTYGGREGISSGATAIVYDPMTGEVLSTPRDNVEYARKHLH